MSQITIQARLISFESNRQQLWKLMADLNTPLINELLCQLGQHPDFEKWQQKGKLPSTVVSQLCQPLKTDPRFAGQPSRLYMSAIHIVDYIYKSWLAIQKRLQQQLDGKTRWLEMLNDEITKFITNMKKKSDLSDTQQAFIQRKQSTLTRINNSFERPSQPLYQGQSQKHR